MTDTPTSTTGGAAAATEQTSSPAPQPAASPAPSGGNKSPAGRQPTDREKWEMGPDQRWQANQPAPPPVITKTQREALRAEGRWPLKPGDDGQPRGTGQQQNAPADPASLEKVKVGDFEMTKAEVAQLVADKAAKDSFKLTTPTPQAYKAEFPADFKLPDGVTFEIDESSPALAQARELCFENGLPQAAFAKMLGAYANIEAQKLVAFEGAKKAEIAKLGAAGPARVDAVLTWMKAVMGPKAAALAGALNHAPVAKTVEAFEDLMQWHSSQGAIGYRSGGREQPERGPSDEQYNAMSYAEKREYTRNAAAAKSGKR
jgi:hypothetical protein